MDKEYSSLIGIYKRMFEMVDAIHFNSPNTADVYGQYIDVPKESVVVPITHSGVGDHRKRRDYCEYELRLGFIGSEAPYKGLPMLKRVIGRLNEEGLKECLSLSVYGGRTGVDGELSNVVYKGRFGYREMSAVYDAMDLLVVPSIWKETFSFTTIEALQFGVPVLVSNNVGAKDIVKNFAPNFVFDKEEKLYKVLKELIFNRDKLKIYNGSIVSGIWQYSIKEHAREIVKNIYKWNF